MSIFVIGINHKTAPVELREKIYFGTDKLTLYLQDLLNRDIAQEAVLLSTCNRSELYCEAVSVNPIVDWFCEQAPEARDCVYTFSNEDAVAHIMHVACGLDSMILGEPQILGQMKEAFSESFSAGGVNTGFNRLFQQIFSVAKEIRTATAIGACPVSVASAAVHFAREHVVQFEHANVALIGAGETSELLLRYLQRFLQKPVTIINRHLEKAEMLSRQYNGKAYKLEQLATALTNIDVVFSATGSPVPLLHKENLQLVMQQRFSPMMLIDIAVPRDIDPSAASVPKVRLFCIDDLKNIIENNRKGREHAAEKARSMIKIKSKEFILEQRSFANVNHTIRAYRNQIEDICSLELAKAKQQLDQGIDPNQVLDSFAKIFINKLMHAPSVQLRQAGLDGRFELLQFAKKLFAIPDVEIYETID